MGQDSVLTPERWALIEALFTHAATLRPEERAAFLAESTGDDVALRRTVEKLLTEHDRDPGFLETPPLWLAPENDVPEPPPERIGEYRILRVLGRGGMGQVYLAEHVAPGFRQQVALKLMRRGLDTDDLLRRFRAERQILATLDHPNIARLLDVGATDSGLPYFVMEYVEGASFLEHCDTRRLNLRQRLALFRTVCAAVQHAHQSLVVHRDLKPGNILVTDAGVPKLLDFGVAKILNPGSGDTDQALTRVGERLLTPEYCAPEQLRGGAITTACDVHALGVLLYKLLVGGHPYVRAGESHGELAHRILELAPDPPSGALRNDPAAEKLAAARATTPEHLRRSLAGDLDTVVLKALRKEPDARYASALSFSEDLGRYLKGLPVEARPATFGYKVRKFVGRHRVAVAAGVALFLLLSGFSAVTAYQSLRIRQEERRVAHERDKALEVRRFLLETFGTRGPDKAAGANASVRELLDRRAATLAGQYAGDPELRAELTGVLAQAYERLGLYEEAEPLATRALKAQRALHGPEHADVVSALDTLGWIQRQRDQLKQAEATLREAVRVGRIVFPPVGDVRLAQSLNDLGAVCETRGRYDDAATAYRESLNMQRRLSGENAIGVFITMSNLAVVLYRRGDLNGAVEMAERAVAGFTRLLGADHERTTIAQGNLAAFRSAQGDHEGSARVYAELLARDRRVLGPRHPQVAYALTARANELIKLKRPVEAESLLFEALDIERETLGPRHERVAYTLRVLGKAAAASNRPAEALARYREALDIVRQVLGPKHKEVAVLRLAMGKAHQALGKEREAEDDYRAAMAGFRAALGARHYLTADATLTFAEFLIDTGRTSKARPLLNDLTWIAADLGPTFGELANRLTVARVRAGLTHASVISRPPGHL